MSKVVLGIVEHRPTYLYVKSLDDAGFIQLRGLEPVLKDVVDFVYGNNAAQ